MTSATLAQTVHLSLARPARTMHRLALAASRHLVRRIATHGRAPTVAHALVFIWFSNVLAVERLHPPRCRQSIHKKERKHTHTQEKCVRANK